MIEERKRFLQMNNLKIQKGMEGEESLLLTQSFPNILEQEIRNEMAYLAEDINDNNLKA